MLTKNRIRKGYLLGIVAVFIIFLLIIPSTVSAEKKYRIGIASWHSHNEWNIGLNGALEMTLKEFGANPIVTYAQGDPERQAKDIESFIARKVDLIIVTGAIRETLVNAVEKAGKEGIPIISVEAYLQGDAVQFEIAANQYVNGIMSADEIINYFHGKANVLTIFRSGFYSLDLRHEAFKMKLAQYPGMKIVAELPHSWENTPEDTMSKVESYLTANPGTVDVVWAGWDLPLVGAANAIEGLKLQDKIKVLGIDAFVPVLENMRRDGCILSAVNQDPNAMGIVTAKAAMKFLNGEKLPYQIFLPLETIRNNYPGYPSNIPKGFMYITNVPKDLQLLGLTWSPEDPARHLVLDK